jgi:hypothetical protein
MDLAAWSIETSSAKVKQMPFPVGSLLEICSSDKIYDSMNKKDKPWQYLCCRNVINNKCNIQKWHRIKAMKQRCIALMLLYLNSATL